MSIWPLPPDISPAIRRTDFACGIQKSNHDIACFGCSHPQGLHISVDYGPELSVTGSLYVTSDMQGGPGVMHGGLISCALDEVMGCATRLVVPFSVTGHLETDFYQPVVLDQKLTINAQVDGIVRRKLYISAEVWGKAPDSTPSAVIEQILLARGYAIFIHIDPEAHYGRFNC